MDESVQLALHSYLENMDSKTKRLLGNCCIRCLFRVVQVPCRLAGCDIYCLPESTLQSFCLAHKVDTRSESCKLCLGLLTDQVLQDFCRIIHIKLQDYKINDTFRISMTLWDSYVVKLQDPEYWTQIEKAQIDLKKCFKWTCGNWIERQFHLSFVVDSDVEIHIQVKEIPRVGKDLEDMVSIVLAPLYFQGRYIKLSRRLSQSPWIVDSVRLAPDSVEECLYDYLLQQLGAKECRFTAGGREDVDVRMLGTGRPFVIQVLGPKYTQSYVKKETFLKEWAKQVLIRSGGQVQVRDMKVSDSYVSLKESEMMKQKTYRCIVYISKDFKDESGISEYLASLTPLTIEQYTPLRVLHRRTLAKRKRIIHSMQLKLLNPHFAILDLVTDAGTYIKEFVHGDLGRTSPHLGTLLGCETDILQLDVLHVHISDW